MFKDTDRIMLEEIYSKVYALQKDVENMRLQIVKTTKNEKTEQESKSPFMNEDGLYSIKEYQKKTNARKYGNLKEVVE